MKVCSSCQTANSPKSRFCRSCGGSLADAQETVNEPVEASTEIAIETISVEDASPLDETLVASENMSETIPQQTLSETECPEPEQLETRDSAFPEAIASASESEITSQAPAYEASYETNSPIPSPISDYADTECPVEISLNFNRLLIANCHSTVEMRVENTSPLAVTNIEIVLDSKALSEPAVERLARLAPGQSAERIIELEPQRFGRFALKGHVGLTSSADRLPQNYRAYRNLRVNQQPDFSGGISINIQDLQGNVGSGANANLGAEYGDVNISNLLGGIQDLNSLLDVELPDNFEPLELQREDENLFETQRRPLGSTIPSKPGFQGAQAHPSPLPATAGAASPRLTIPPAFIGYQQAATTLELVPENSRERDVEGLPAIRFVTKSEFVFGRNRQEVDFLTWFWPLDKEAKEKTKGLSKRHAVATLDSDGYPAFENLSENSSYLNGSLIENGAPEALHENGTLALGADYQTRVKLVSPAPEPVISNLNAWSGGYALQIANQPNETRSRFGNIHFRPVDTDYALTNAIWLFSDALIGRNSDCAVRLGSGPEFAARIRWWKGQFWLEGLARENGIELDGHAIQPQSIYPLCRGARLQIHGANYRIEATS